MLEVDPIRLVFVSSLALVPFVILGSPALIAWILRRLGLVNYRDLWFRRYLLAYGIVSFSWLLFCFYLYLVNDIIGSIATFGLSITPLILVFTPTILFLPNSLRTRFKFASRIYLRIALGFSIFWALYYIFPSILSQLVPPAILTIPVMYTNPDGTISTQWRPDLYTLLRYEFQLIGNSIATFLVYPIQLFPFIFVISPMLAVGILFILLYRADRETSLVSKIRELQFEYDTNPLAQIKERILEPGWQNEWDMLKILLAILPISLYLLMTLLKVLSSLTGVNYQENPNILQGTSLGWFLEIFFVYLGVIVFSIHLLSSESSRISFRGRYVGDRLRQNLVRALSTVGALVSAIAMLLFLLDYLDTIIVVAFFLAYFVMVSILFVLFLDVFEPISIYILVHFIQFLKNFRLAIQETKILRLVGVFAFGFSVSIFLSLAVFVLQYAGQILWGTSFNRPSYNNFFWMVFGTFFVLLIFAAATRFVRRWNWQILQSTAVLYLAGMAYSVIGFVWYKLIPFSPEITSFLKLINLVDRSTGIIRPYAEVVPGSPIILPWTFQTALADPTAQWWWASLFREAVVGFTFGDVILVVPDLQAIPVHFPPFLELLAYPYYLLHPLAIIMLFGTMVFLIGRSFKTITTPLGEKTMSKAIYAKQEEVPSFKSLQNRPYDFLLSIEENPEWRQDISDQTKLVGRFLAENEITWATLQHRTQISPDELHESLDELRDEDIHIFQKDYDYAFEKVRIESINVMMVDGRSIFTHVFVEEETEVEPALLAGLFAAITSFAKETVRSEQLLRTIDHGDVVLTIEYGNLVFAVVIASTESTALRNSLVSFLAAFEEKHANVLPNWLGDMSPFADDHSLAESHFAQLVEGGAVEEEDED